MQTLKVLVLCAVWFVLGVIVQATWPCPYLVQVVR